MNEIESDTGQAVSHPTADGCLIGLALLAVSMLGLGVSGYLGIYEVAIEYLAVFLFLYVAMFGLNRFRKSLSREGKIAFSPLTIFAGKTANIRDSLDAPLGASPFGTPKVWRATLKILIAAMVLGWIITLVRGLALQSSWAEILRREIAETILDVIVFLPLIITLAYAFRGYTQLADIHEEVAEVRMEMGTPALQGVKEMHSKDPQRTMVAISYQQRLLQFNSVLIFGLVVFALSMAVGASQHTPTPENPPILEQEHKQATSTGRHLPFDISH